MRGFFDWLERKKYKVHVRVFLSRYRGYQTCPDCQGTRLRREARAVRVGGRTIDEVSALTTHQARDFFAALELQPQDAAIADKVLTEIRRRLGFLSDVGLEYLTLDRLSSTLSGGEAQRINLATSLGASLVGTLYVLDEPSIGLHPRDNQRLIAILRQLRDQGNTVIVVEHDADMIAVADHVVDMGLGAGEHGGRVIYSGPLAGLTTEPRSLTAKYLRDELQIPVPAARRKGTAAAAAAGRRPRAQPEGRGRRDPAQHADLHHRGERLGQVDAGARRALRRAQARQGRLGSQGRLPPPPRRRRVPDRRGAGGPDANRPHPALESGHLSQGVRSDPRAARRDQGRPVPRPDRQPLLLQRPGRPLRGLPGRRRGQGRDAVPRRRLRAVRAVRRQALQGQRARRALQGQERHPDPRPHRARGAAVLQRLAQGAAPAAGARRDRPRLPAAGPAGDDALGRRSAAGEDRRAPGLAQAASGCSTSSTSRPPACTSTTSPSC